MNNSANHAYQTEVQRKEAECRLANACEAMMQMYQINPYDFQMKAFLNQPKAHSNREAIRGWAREFGIHENHSLSVIQIAQVLGKEMASTYDNFRI